MAAGPAPLARAVSSLPSPGRRPAAGVWNGPVGHPEKNP